MKFALASDLHLEFADITLTNDEDASVLVLSGDIMIAQDLHDHPDPIANDNQPWGRRQLSAQRYRDFLSRVSNEFPHVIYIAGNHEFYHGKWKGSLEDLRNECSRYPNVHFMEDDILKVEDVTFIGSTLWSDMNKGDPLTLHAVTDMMNDYKLIRNDELGYTKLRPTHSALRHRQSLGYIKTITEGKFDEKFVVVGHHGPSNLSVDDRYKSQSLMNGAYVSELSDFILDHPQIKVWTHGHTHVPFDYTIGETRIVSTPAAIPEKNSTGDLN